METALAIFGILVFWVLTYLIGRYIIVDEEPYDFSDYIHYTVAGLLGWAMIIGVVVLSIGMYKLISGQL